MDESYQLELLEDLLRMELAAARENERLSAELDQLRQDRDGFMSGQRAGHDIVWNFIINYRDPLWECVSRINEVCAAILSVGALGGGDAARGILIDLSSRLGHRLTDLDQLRAKFDTLGDGALWIPDMGRVLDLYAAARDYAQKGGFVEITRLRELIAAIGDTPALYVEMRLKTQAGDPVTAWQVTKFVETRERLRQEGRSTRAQYVVKTMIADLKRVLATRAPIYPERDCLTDLEGRPLKDTARRLGQAASDYQRRPPNKVR